MNFLSFFRIFHGPGICRQLMNTLNWQVSQSELKAAKVWKENADGYFPDTETMIGWLDQPSLVPFLVCVPETYKANFREYVVGEMIRETKQADGRCFETFRRINLFAKS